MRRRAWRLVPMVCGLLTALAGAPAGLQAQVRGVLLEDTRSGRPAPALQLRQATASGVRQEPYDLGGELGLVVVLSFCSSLSHEGCLNTWRGWQDAPATFGAGVSVVGVTPEAPSRVAELASAARIQGRFLSDSAGRAARRWGVPGRREGAVAVFVITPEGRIAYRDLQYDPTDSGAWERLWRAVAAVRMPAHR